jgi:hypothetical protein
LKNQRLLTILLISAVTLSLFAVSSAKGLVIWDSTSTFGLSAGANLKITSASTVTYLSAAATVDGVVFSDITFDGITTGFT